MICPVPHEQLVRHWLHDLADDEADAIDEHVFGCAACFHASAQVAAMAQALATVIPPVPLDRDLELAEARGLRLLRTDLQPGVPVEVWFRAGIDLLVHRLVGDLEDVEQVSVAVVLADGAPLVTFADVPFEPSAGVVLLACQRHFVAAFPPDVDVVVHRWHRTGHETEARYTILHRVD